MRLLILLAALLVAAPAYAQQGDVHAPWDVILAKYLSEHPDGVNRFDYAALRDTPADRTSLEDYIDTLEAAAPSEMGEDEAFAYWANLYNAVTVRLIVVEAPAGVDSRNSPPPVVHRTLGRGPGDGRGRGSVSG